MILFDCNRSRMDFTYDFRNCQLVFEIAEKELGIPALLDPKVKKLFEKFLTLEVEL